MLKIETVNYFELLDYQRKQLISELDKYKHQQLIFKPSATAWSTAQVVEHLFLVEKSAKASIEKRLSKEKALLQQANWRSSFRKQLLSFALALPVKYKVPTPLIEPQNNDYELSKEQWLSVRKEMKLLLDQIDKDVFNKELFKHPLVGDMRLIDMFKFLNQHTHHHHLQIQRISQHISFPV